MTTLLEYWRELWGPSGVASFRDSKEEIHDMHKGKCLALKGVRRFTGRCSLVLSDDLWNTESKNVGYIFMR